jgi:hypothetical protein
MRIKEKDKSFDVDFEINLLKANEFISSVYYDMYICFRFKFLELVEYEGECREQFDKNKFNLFSMGEVRDGRNGAVHEPDLLLY